MVNLEFQGLRVVQFTVSRDLMLLCHPGAVRACVRQTND